MSARWPALASALRRAALLAAGVLVWELVARSGMFSPIIVPSVTRIAYQLWLLAIQPESVVEAWYSVFRALSGFALAAVVGVALGVLMGRSSLAAHCPSRVVFPKPGAATTRTFAPAGRPLAPHTPRRLSHSATASQSGLVLPFGSC